jgi:putative SOS response-associated peptidase YedK
MCNLYSMTATVDEMRRIFGPFDGDTTNLPPYDEIFPGHSAPVIRRKNDGALKLDMMKWGFPGPAGAGSRPVTNVRNLNSGFWRNALTDPRRRCIVPVTSFCEWTGEVGRKEKVWFGLTEEQHPLFAFAGIWRSGEGGLFMAILTCAANEMVGAVHPQAMPVMLRPGTDVAQWLDCESAEACALAKPFADTEMRRVS